MVMLGGQHGSLMFCTGRSQRLGGAFFVVVIHGLYMAGKGGTLRSREDGVAGKKKNDWEGKGREGGVFGQRMKRYVFSKAV